VGVLGGREERSGYEAFFEWRNLALVLICIVLNLGIGLIVTTLKLPFYLDSIGTVLATALGGLGAGIIAGVLSVVIGSAYTPTLWALREP